MKIRWTRADRVVSAIAVALSLLTVVGAEITASPAAAADAVVREIRSAETVTVGAGTPGGDGVGGPELDPGLRAPAVVAKGPAAVRFTRGRRTVNRSLARGQGSGERVDPAERAASHPELALSFDGLNFRQQRLANDGNQFSVEPPDQGLCVGNGYVLETVNSVLQVFDTDGHPRTPPIDLNSFYGYRPAIDRAAGEFGPLVFDPSCYFDRATQRWFHVAITQDRVGTTEALSGTNHLDLAVSTGPSPLDPWIVYRVPVQNDGSDGTPVHADCPCLGDFPHIGADAHGVYVTTNEFSLVTGAFNGAQVYALSKRALAEGRAGVTLVQFDTADRVLDGGPGFGVWPAISAGGDFERANLGTEYFLSSVAVFNDNGTDDRLRIWALTNTESLEGRIPRLLLSDGVVRVGSYGVPPPSSQKPGATPLADCVNDTTLPTSAGTGCWRLLLTDEPAHAETLSALDSSDSRMQQVAFTGGKLYAALDTVVNVGGAERAGIAYYVLRPFATPGSVFGLVQTQGRIAVSGNNVSYPAIAALPTGAAVMAFTLVGADHHPSAAYVTVDEFAGAGPIHVVAEGVGPQDGFSGYVAFNAPDPVQPRWGDYGAAVADGDAIWIASEYIAQTCTFAEYVAEPFGSCGGTRAALGNWATRISKIVP